MTTDTNNIIPIEEKKVYFLFKRGLKEHIQALYENGEVFINSIEFIRNCDNNEERSDEDDGIYYRRFLGDGEVTMCNIGKDINNNGVTFSAIDITEKTDYEEKGNIYCLTGIFSDHLSGDRKDLIFNTKSFGESIILIHSPNKFLNRLFKALIKEGYKDFKSNKVAYYDNSYSGEVGFFKKHEKFRSQNEYRIYIPNKNNEPIKLNIGSLKDIAVMDKNLLKLKYTDNKEQIISL